MFNTISLDISMKKLAALTAHTLRGRLRIEAFFSGVSVAGVVSTGMMGYLSKSGQLAESG
jgi:hypothetical protein